jgi:mannitol/fructose-specific phosphotransferase system IIA component (Ntr-type)
MAGALISDTLALIAFAAIMGVVDVGTVDVADLSLVTLKALLFFGVTVTVGYKAFPWLGRRMAEAGLTNRTFHFTLVLLIAVTFAQLAEVAGLHGILGAFVAGLFIRDNVLGRSLARDLTSSVREASLGLLAPIFFVTAGFEVSFRIFVGSDLWLLLAIVGVSVVGKILGTVLFYLPTGHGWREGLTVGMGMNGRGAVEIIVAGIGLERGLISQEIFSILVFMAIFTTASVPIMLKWGTDWLKARGELVRSGAERQGTVIVGAGPLGRLLAKHLSTPGPVRLIDSNPDRCRLAEEAGLRAYCGNALQEQDLSEAGAAEAGSLVALTTNPAVNALVARMATETFGIRDVYVVQVTPEELNRDGALQHLRASILFGGPLAREEWEHRVALDAYSAFEQEVEDETTGAAFRDALENGGQYLPLLVRHGESASPFHTASRLRPRDRVVILRPEGARRRGSESFRQIVRTCRILDLDEPLTAEEFFVLAAAQLTSDGEQRTLLLEALKSRESLGSTVLARGLAIPHVTAPVPGIAPLLVARSRSGISFPGVAEPVHAVFTLVRVPGGAGSDLQTLAAIAQVASRSDFRARWREAADTEELRDFIMGSLAATV